MVPVALRAFTFTPIDVPLFSIGGIWSQAAFTPDPGITDVLEVDGVNNKAFLWGAGPYFSSDFTPYNPSRYYITSTDRVRYLLEEGKGLIRVEDAYKNSLEFKDSGIYHSNGTSVIFERDSSNRIIKVYNLQGKFFQYDYDSNGDMIAVTNPALETTRYSYDEHRLISITDPLGKIILTNTYSNDRLVKQIDASGNVTGLISDPDSKIEKIKDPRGNVTEARFDKNGNFAQLIDALGNSIKYEYDENFRLSKVTDPLGRTRSIKYNNKGEPKEIVNTLGHRKTYEYTENLGRNNVLASKITKVIDERGNPSVFLEDYQRRAVSSRSAEGVSNSTILTFQGLPGFAQDGENTMMQYFYDAAGNPAGMGYLFSDEVSNNPDLSIVSRPDGKYQQVAAGNQKLEITYDSVGQPIKLTNAEGGVTTFTYDANGRRKTLTDPVGNTSTFNYNNDGNLIEEVDPLGNSLSYAYDANGNLVRSTDRNGRIREYRYDALNRLVEERWLEGTTVVENRKYGYDAVDNLLSEEDSMGRYEYTYDAANRIETASNKGLSGLPDMMLTYKYDTVGNLTSVSDNTGTAVHSTYDRDNRLTSSYWLRGSDEVLRFNFTYNARNQIKSVERVRGSDSQVFSTSEYAYSYEGLIESIKHNHTATSAVLREFAYTYDETYRPKTKSHGGNTANYEYDKTSQIIAVDNIASADESFSYDLNGNRRMMGYLIERPNRVAETSTHLYGYDLEGNLIRKTDKSTGKYFVYSWDHLNRMTQAEEFSADGSRSLTRVNFYYDVRNRRIGKVVRGGKTIRTVYYDDLAWLDVGESGEVIARYMFGNTIDEILAREKVGNGLASYLPDHLGTIEDVVDVATENVVNNPEYEVFGGVRSEDGAPAGDRFKFTGREYDAETGLFYYRARYYDPGIGRFISEDPIRNRSGDRNFYRYTSNLPVLLTDPSGNSAEEYARNLLNRLGLVTMIRSAVWSGFEAGIVSGICEAHSKGFRNINWSEVAHDTAAVGTSIGLIFGALDLYLNPEYSIKELRPGKGEATAKKTRSIRKRAKKLEERLERTVRNAALIAVIQQTVQCYLDGLNE